LVEGAVEEAGVRGEEATGKAADMQTRLSDGTELTMTLGEDEAVGAGETKNALTADARGERAEEKARDAERKQKGTTAFRSGIQGLPGGGGEGALA
jgi:hypothetical protein